MASAKVLKELETLQKVHKQIQQRLTAEETASQATNSKTEELQRALKDAKDALKRETERAAKIETTVVNLRGKNEDLQKELDDLVREDTGRNGEVSLSPPSDIHIDIDLGHESPTRRFERSRAKSRVSSRP